MQQATKPKLYFPGLNGLRFFAAILVLFFHAEFVLPPVVSNRFLQILCGNGNNSVTFFFVLSGFLITYLLCVESENTANQGVNTWHFYKKRIIRIWPLYYGLLLLTVLAQVFFYPEFVLQWVDNEALLLIAALFPQIAYTYFNLGNLLHFWSIGVEEQFYFLYPLVINVAKSNLEKTLWAVIVLKAVFYWVFSMLLVGVLSPKIVEIFNLTGFEKMAWGGIAALWIYKKRFVPNQSVLFSKPAQLCYFAILFYYLSTNYYTMPLSDEKQWFALIFRDLLGYYLIVPLLFLYLILNISLNQRSFLSLEHRMLRYLGDISYGIYMFHMAGIAVGHWVATRLPQFTADAWSYRLVFYIAAIMGTIGMAALSFEFYEKQFLRFRPTTKVSK